jgi:hypothetical protein
MAKQPPLVGAVLTVIVYNSLHVVPSANTDPHSCEVDGNKASTVLSAEDTSGFEGLSTPAVKAKDPVGLRDSVPALQI